MKLRITKDSVRLRLSQTDVRRFSEDGVIEEELSLGGSASQSLIYRLVGNGKESDPYVNIEDNKLTVGIPAGKAADWYESDTVSIEGMHARPDGSKVTILVEKDFACLNTRTGDDDKDTFPHPAAP